MRVPLRPGRDDSRNLTAPTQPPAHPIDVVRAYHTETKHLPHRYADGPGYLDWDNQPDPFRRFAGAPISQLPFATQRPDHRLDDLGERRDAVPLSAHSISLLLEHSLAISAWKSAGAKRWALRCNPSSGNLHPTEGYLLLPPIDGIAAVAALHHYRSVDHVLEQRCGLSHDAWATITRGVPAGSFVVGLSSVIWREAWKYGERAFRYCQHDVGHALAALQYAASLLGWRLRVASRASDADVSAILGLDRSGDFGDAEHEHPDLLAIVATDNAPSGALGAWPDDAIVDAVRGGRWTGHANRLSEETVRWRAIDAAMEACVKHERTEASAAGEGVARARDEDRDESTAATLILQRRSAVDFDGRTTLGASRFFRMLERAMPHRAGPPLDAFDHAANVHLAIFVHRVESVPPGLYALVRTPSALGVLKDAFDPEFDWARVEMAPTALPLYQLALGDARDLARSISCGQDIAADGAFSLGMIAEFEPRLREHGAWFYRRLFWETGAIGQVFYLESEAAGARATGIGCFFDDLMHRLLGIHDDRFQSLYHLAVGTPLDDPRISTLPAYAHRSG